MKAPPSTLQHYETIAGLSRQMLAKAQAQQWDDVVVLGAQYHDAVERLRAIGTLSDEDRNARRRLLTQILTDDACIRNLAAPELHRLSHLLGMIKRQQTVLQAYSSSEP
ncbi:flagellar protein FliT [Alcaligenaceae bacterium CGII-47]|nr:flagellar protein FliT [Alcaligenaceae bacterium CGII-47]